MEARSYWVARNKASQIQLVHSSVVLPGHNILTWPPNKIDKTIPYSFHHRHRNVPAALVVRSVSRKMCGSVGRIRTKTWDEH